MKWARRRLFEILTVASLLLGLAIAGLWWRSYGLVDEWFVIFKRDGSAKVSTRRGTLTMRLESPPPGKVYGGVQRVTHRTSRESSFLPDAFLPRDTTVHYQLAGVRYDAMPLDEVLKADAAARKTDAKLAAIAVQLRDASSSQPSDDAARQLIFGLTYRQGQLRMDQDMARALGHASNAHRHLRIPLWYLIVASLFIPILWLLRAARRRRRTSRGVCYICGYDLRASPVRCPECGTVRNATTT